MLPLVVLDETQGTPVIESEAEIPHYSGLPVPQEARVIDPGNASLDLKEYLEGTTALWESLGGHPTILFQSHLESSRVTWRSSRGHQESFRVIQSHLEVI